MMSLSIEQTQPHYLGSSCSSRGKRHFPILCLHVSRGPESCLAQHDSRSLGYSVGNPALTAQGVAF